MRYNKCKACKYGAELNYLGCHDCTPDNEYGSFKSKDMPRKELAWEFNLYNFKDGLFGDPKDPWTILRYWKAQEAVDYPGASDNVKYFTDIVEKRQQSRERDHTETLLLFIKKYLHDILDDWYSRQDEPHFYENNIGVYNHVKKELDDLYAYAEKLGINLDEEDEIDATVQ